MKRLSEEEIQEKLADLPLWEYAEDAIHTSLIFGDFKEAFSAMVRIAFEAEQQQHHPNWSNVYNELTISLSTHDAGGVTEKDFKLAHSIGRIVAPEE